MKPKRGNRRLAFASLLLALFLFSAGTTLVLRLWPELTRPKRLDLAFQMPPPLELASLPTATRFDFPLGSEHGAMAYNAQRFTENRHLGDDLNGIGGENSDLGDPVHAVADGRVLLAREGGPGWGNIIIVLHAYLKEGARAYVQSYYGHVETMLVHAGEDVHRGPQIATVYGRWPLLRPSSFRDARISHSLCRARLPAGHPRLARSLPLHPAAPRRTR